MATQKKPAKPAVKKPAPKKVVASKTAKKQAVVKKQVKTVPKKVGKPAVKKAVAKPAAKKIISKPVAKKTVSKAPVKQIPAKKATKPAAKPIVKAAPVAKKAPKKVIPSVKSSQSVVKAAPKKTAVASKSTTLPMTKKIEEKKTAKKVVAETAVVKTPAKAPKEVKAAAPKPVVIPKTNTKTVRKYQPDFTKSVLDQPKNDPGASIVRYNDNDLIEFRELIQRKLGAAKKELSYLQGLITRKDELGGDESDNRYMTMEDGSLSMEREQLSQMASRQITFIDHLEKALMRIENKTYGICRVTGKLIDKARLRAVPHATLSIEAKMGQK
jgi:RNA polymerase-binding transcription factor DksA